MVVHRLDGPHDDEPVEGVEGGKPVPSLVGPEGPDPESELGGPSPEHPGKPQGGVLDEGQSAQPGANGLP